MNQQDNLLPGSKTAIILNIKFSKGLCVFYSPVVQLHLCKLKEKTVMLNTIIFSRKNKLLLPRPASQQYLLLF